MVSPSARTGTCTTTVWMLYLSATPISLVASFEQFLLYSSFLKEIARQLGDLVYSYQGLSHGERFSNPPSTSANLMLKHQANYFATRTLELGCRAALTVDVCAGEHSIAGYNGPASTQCLE